MDMVTLSEYLSYYSYVIDIPFYRVWPFRMFGCSLWGSLTGLPAQYFQAYFSYGALDFAILFYVYTSTYTERSLPLNLKYRQ